MPIFISMIVWICFMRMLYSNRIKAYRLSRGVIGYKVNTSVSILTMGYIVFWIGMSSYMADSSAYIRLFTEAPTDLSQISEQLSSESKSVLWNISVIVFKNLVSDNYQVWLMTLNILMGFSVSHSYRKYSEAFFFSMLLFVLNCDFSWMFNGIRQFCCVAALMLALPWVIKGETKKYMILLAVLSQIHFSELVMIPIYFVVRQQPWSKLVLLSILGVILICAFITPFMDGMHRALENTAYSGVNLMSENDDGAHPVRVLILSVPAILAWFCRKQIAAENSNVLNICINFSVISALLMLVAVFSSGIMMGRLAIYCSVYSAILLPMLINRWPNKGQRKLIKTGAVICYSYYFYITMSGQYYYSTLTGWID